MARATIAHQWDRAIACVLLILVLQTRSSAAGMLAVYRPLRQLIGERPAVVVKNRKN